MSGKIWLVGGTTESAAIAILISKVGLPCIVTVVSTTARSLYPANFEVSCKSMDAAAMQHFCQKNSIVAVVDASHPYAVEVSQQAIATATKLNLPYLRYERNAIARDGDNLLVTQLDSFATLLAGKYLQDKRVLLTVGCKVLPRFKAWHDRATLFARILPKLESLDIALESGFTSDRLICLRPPINLALEAALWRQWNISLVVTKASGVAGGEDIKSQVAAKLNIPLIIITRPKVDYPQQTDSIDEVIVFCQQHLFKK